MRVARARVVVSESRPPIARRTKKTLIAGARRRLALSLTLAAFLLLVQATEAEPPAGLTGQIVYSIVDSAGDSNVYLVDPGGMTLPSLIWTGPHPLPIFPSVEWRPDGGEIALKSAHEWFCSRWDSDLYGLAPNGSSIRRITNAPDCATLASFPQGSVDMTVDRTSPGLIEAYGVWVDGAQTHTDLLLSSGQSKEVTVPNVADLGAGRQQYVWIKAEDGTYIFPSSSVDVLPSQTTTVADNPVIAEGFGPFKLSIVTFTWSGDGSAIAAGLEVRLRYIVPADPTTPLETGDSVFDNTEWDISELAWAPVSDRFLYYSSSHPTQPGVYLASRGSDGADHVFVFDPTDFAFITTLAWLPDESGFLYSLTRYPISGNEIGHYDFATGDRNIYSGDACFSGVSVSPDGEYFAWASGCSGTWRLWGRSLSTEEEWLIVDSGSDVGISWDWGVICDLVPLDLSDPTPITGPWLEVDCLRIDVGPLVAATGSSGILSAPTVALRNGVEIGSDAALTVKN